MNRETVRNFVVGIIILALVIMIFVIAESKGAAFSSRIIMIGFALIVALIGIAGYLGKKDPELESSTEEVKPKPATTKKKT
jgi:hypothetical protein